MRLTAKQRKFVDAYVESGNAKQAAIDAGYSKRTAKSIGQENLTKPDLKKAIQARMKKLEDAKIMKADEAMRLLTRIARGEEQETVVVSGIDYTDTIKKEADLKTRITAIREILKRYPDAENDPLLAAQVKKTSAEADMAEAKAKRESRDTSDHVTVNIEMPGDDDDAS